MVHLLRFVLLGVVTCFVSVRPAVTPQILRPSKLGSWAFPYALKPVGIIISPMCQILFVLLFGCKICMELQGPWASKFDELIPWIWLIKVYLYVAHQTNMLLKIQLGSVLQQSDLDLNHWMCLFHGFGPLRSIYMRPTGLMCC